jgi:hypothetical protein
LRRTGTGAAIALFLAGTVIAAACGARSELGLPREQPDGGNGGDAGPDAEPDAAPDVPEDVPPDAPPECTEDVTYIYLVSSQNELWAYKPQSNAFELRGTLDCPPAAGSPFSMAVARDGIAHVLYNSGNLFRVDVADASCESTPFEPGQLGFVQFGMGYAANDDNFGETLYVAEISFSAPPIGLASIDTITYELSFIAPFSETFGFALELTPSGKGPLYGYFLSTTGPGGTLVEIDEETAEILSAMPLTAGMGGATNLAIAWWGGSFYIFTGFAGGGTEANRYDPSTGQVSQVTTHPQSFVGAGVSTCAPAGN